MKKSPSTILIVNNVQQKNRKSFTLEASSLE